MAYCTACGHLISDAARFCRSCGTLQDVQMEQAFQDNTATQQLSDALEDTAVVSGGRQVVTTSSSEDAQIEAEEVERNSQPEVVPKQPGYSPGKRSVGGRVVRGVGRFIIGFFGAFVVIGIALVVLWVLQGLGVPKQSALPWAAGTMVLGWILLGLMLVVSSLKERG